MHLQQLNVSLVTDADFENAMNDYLSDGYKVEASSCNSKYYKAILVLEENN